MQLPYFLALLICVCRLCNGDIYMHNPRGSNNRLNEKTATRTNANRMFDSQNNDRGGYNVGDKNVAAATTQDEQYRMKFFQSSNKVRVDKLDGRSELTIEWTNQHGCGGNEDTDPHKMNCNIVLQLMCQDDTSAATADDGITLRDGLTTETQTYTKLDGTPTKAKFVEQRGKDVNPGRGLQEPWFWYDACVRRERNKGLFSATQTLTQQGAISTRQNPKGTRRGYECPEERDYFPYWHPTPFIDVAILAQNDSMCSYYEKHSFNRAAKYLCLESFDGGGRKHYSEYSTEEKCVENGKTWTAFYSMLELAPSYTNKASCEKSKGDGLSYKWGKPWDPAKIDAHTDITDVCFVQPPKIDCKAAGWTRTNHLGNGREGVPLNYTMTLPYFPSGKTKRCVLRSRYNISTDDYDPWNTFATSNDLGLIQQNPLVDVGANGQPLRLAINTAQTGRTFQDRSHVFKLEPRPANFAADARVLNLNVRGKRGNIVQTFPAVEYDFFPTRFEIRKEKDYVHVQWTGSNTHNNAGPGGDGQAGSNGEGQAGTDRHNLLETLDADINYPTPYEATTMWKNAKVMWSYSGDLTLTQDNLALMLGTGGYYECIESCGNSVDDREQLQVLLNNAAASFEGVVIRFDAAGEYFYICSRNNNFTNRSQKGHLKVK